MARNTAGLSEALYQLECCDNYGRSAKALVIAGLAWKLLGYPKQAIERLTKAKELDPSNPAIEQHLSKFQKRNT